MNHINRNLFGVFTVFWLASSLFAAPIKIDTPKNPVLSDSEISSLEQGQVNPLALAVFIHSRATSACLDENHDFGVFKYSLSKRPDKKMFFAELWCNDKDSQQEPDYFNKTAIRFAANALEKACATDAKLSCKIDDATIKQIYSTNFLIKNALITNKDRVWIDLEPSSFYELTQNHTELIVLIDKYQDIAKTDPRKFAERIVLLNEIIFAAEKILAATAKDPAEAIKLILQMAKNKRDYLTELIRLPDELQIHIDLSQKRKMGHSDLLTYWGGSYSDELLFYLDPGSRPGIKGLFKRYFRQEIDRFKPFRLEDEYQHWPRFFYWLEDQKALVRRESGHGLRPFAPNPAKQITFIDGKAFMTTAFGDTTKSPRIFQNETFYPVFSCDQQGCEYNIDENGLLYINLSASKHSSVNHGRPAMSAGMINFIDGKISIIDRNSGHYKPSHQNLTNALAKLRATNGDDIFDSFFTPEKPGQVHYKKPIGRELSLKEILRRLEQSDAEQKSKKSLFSKIKGEISLDEFFKNYQTLPEKNYPELDGNYQKLFTELHRPLANVKLIKDVESKIARAYAKKMLESIRKFEVSLEELRTQIKILLVSTHKDDENKILKILHLLDVLSEIFKKIHILQHQKEMNIDDVYLIAVELNDLKNDLILAKYEMQEWPKESPFRIHFDGFYRTWFYDLYDQFKIPFDSDQIDPLIGRSGLDSLPYNLKLMIWIANIKPDEKIIYYNDTLMSLNEITNLSEFRKKEYKNLDKELSFYQSLSQFHELIDVQ